ncbi:hypothetical protein KCU95_g10818, partial [Aureobasidium melanogenum]
MLRNITNHVDFEDLKLFLDATSEGHYDFSYLCIGLSRGGHFRAPIWTPFFSTNTYLCLSQQGEPFGFKRVEIELAGLSEHERSLIRNRPVPVTYPINADGTSARLYRAVAHTRTLSNTIKSVTTAPATVQPPPTKRQASGRYLSQWKANTIPQKFGATVRRRNGMKT